MCRSKQKGFTVLELLIVVFILLILAGLLVPVYMHYSLEVKKSEATCAISRIVEGAEDYYQDHRTFVGGSIEQFTEGPLGQFEFKGEVIENKYFVIFLSNLTATGFVVTARVKGDWAPEETAIVWLHTGADSLTGDTGSGEFLEYY
jgi:prepilin-type N-terminal cleavage/methylation domain-containing protein